MTHERDEDAIERIVRAFDAATERFAQAGSFDEQEDETSNLLHHLNRLMLALYGDPAENRSSWSELNQDPAMRLPLALRELRHIDVHGLVRIVELQDRYADTYTDLEGTLTWDLADAPQNDRQRDGFRKHKVVKRLDQQAVLDSLTDARTRLVSG